MIMDDKYQSDSYEQAVIDIEMIHASLRMELGWPAVLKPGEKFPSFKIKNIVAPGVLTGKVIYQGEVIQKFSEKELMVNSNEEIKIVNLPNKEGLYQVEFKYESLSYPKFHDSFYFTIQDEKQLAEKESKIAYLAKDGKMVYVPDYKGNHIPDFSQVGYMAGKNELPNLPVKVTLKPKPGKEDDTSRIQEAIDQVSKMPKDGKGFRGTVLLKKGEYRLGKTLEIKASGIVLRGEGQNEEGTFLNASAKEKYSLISVKGPGRREEISNTRTRILNNYVPVGIKIFYVEDPSSYNVGDSIIVYRPATQKWINDLGMGPGGILDAPGKILWKPEEYGLEFERKITAIDGNKITIDIPIMNAMERKYGGGEIYKYSFTDRIKQVGIENLRIESQFDKSVLDLAYGNDRWGEGEYYSDENHCWNGIVFENVEDAWAKNISTKYLGNAAVSISRGGKRITVQDCSYLEGVSVIRGGRRYAFNVGGQQNLVKNCYSYKARHDFVLPSRVPGPNVFYNNRAEHSYCGSEPHHRWSTGILYDNCDVEGPHGHFIVANRGDTATGHGWSGSNVVFWNVKAPLIVAMQPPTAQNYAIGVSGLYDPKKYKVLINSVTNWTNNVSRSNFTYEGVPFLGDAYFEYPQSAVKPGSLYQKQLKEAKIKK